MTLNRRMPDNYFSIESSDNDRNEGNKIPVKSLLQYFAFAIILVIATFIAATIILLLTYPNGGNHNFTQKKTVTFKSLETPSSDGTLRPPIGGRLKCSTRQIVQSPTNPIDANQVRPADIKYIAAMGDSLTTGYTSYNEQRKVIDEKMRNIVGNSFIMGGDGELQTHLTLANIFRHLNHSVLGYSTGEGMNEAQTSLNVAFTGVWTDDMQRQARELIRRFGKYPAQSIRDDWKLINIFTGTRDISGLCLGYSETDKYQFKRNLTEAILILQSALPKTIISIIGPANLNFMFRAENIIKQIEFTPCKFYDFDLLAQRRIEQFREAINEVILELGMNSRKDQVVITQHIFNDLWEPLRWKNGSFNTDFYATDGFHFSNYGNSLVAKQLWNQLVSPDNRKITTNDMMSDESPDVLCPTYRCPFIRTPANSVDCKLSDENVIV